MASLIKDPGGRKRISFVHPDGGRKTIRLGKMPLADARVIKTHVEAIIASKTSGQPLDGKTAAWVRDTSNDLANKLAKHNLIVKRGNTTLASFIADYIKKRQDVKPASKTVWHQGEKSLIEYFGADRSVRRITTAEAEDFKQTLIGQGLATYTVRKRLQSAKMFFNAMIRRKLIDEKPVQWRPGSGGR